MSNAFSKRAKPISAVFFDAGNTLLYASPDESRVLADQAKRYGYDLSASELAESVAYAFYQLENKTIRDASFWGSHSLTRSVWLDFYAAVLNQVGVDGVAPAIAEATCDHFSLPEAWKVYPEVLGILDELSRRGIVKGIVSNWDLNLPHICSSLGLSEHLDFIVASGRLGRSKPYPEIFQAAVQRAGFPADECLHVGDHYFSDILGARSAGIEAVLVDRKHGRFGYDCPVATDLTGILDLLD